MKDNCGRGCGFLVCGGESMIGGGNVCYEWEGGGVIALEMAFEKLC